MAKTSGASDNDNLNTYVIDAEDAMEMARLLNQDVLITRLMGGLFPERSDNLENIDAILDIASGPGGWVLGVAREYPEIKVIGIDISERMVTYAHAHTVARSLHNASFQVMDAMKPLNFPDASFDLVNARTLFAVMNAETWPKLLQEMMRVCRPAGTLRLTEGELTLSNSPALEKFNSLFLRAFQMTGRTFLPDGRNLGITTALGRFLSDAGCQNVQRNLFTIDFSSGTEAHEGWYQDIMIGFELASPFLLKLNLLSKQEFELLHQQLIGELLSKDFCGLGFGLTAWGNKPA
jgi:ubiquinone/menaquinone biosynthesis C-methylase UbiE